MKIRQENYHFSWQNFAHKNSHYRKCKSYKLHFIQKSLAYFYPCRYHLSVSKTSPLLCPFSLSQQGCNLRDQENSQLADTYKVPELKVDEQASKCRFNYQAWIMKLQPILAMFPQRATVLPRDKVIPYADPTAMGNLALYLLLLSSLIPIFNEPFANMNPLVTKCLNCYKSSACISAERTKLLPWAAHWIQNSRKWNCQNFFEMLYLCTNYRRSHQ